MAICFHEINKLVQKFLKFYRTLLFEIRFTSDTLLPISSILVIQITIVQYLRDFLLLRFRHSDTHPILEGTPNMGVVYLKKKINSNDIISSHLSHFLSFCLMNEQ
jgi:hypothetical protein